MALGVHNCARVGVLRSPVKALPLDRQATRRTQRAPPRRRAGQRRGERSGQSLGQRGVPRGSTGIPRNRHRVVPWPHGAQNSTWRQSNPTVAGKDHAPVLMCRPAMNRHSCRAWMPSDRVESEGDLLFTAGSGRTGLGGKGARVDRLISHLALATPETSWRRHLPGPNHLPRSDLRSNVGGGAGPRLGSATVSSKAIQ